MLGEECGKKNRRRPDVNLAAKWCKIKPNATLILT